MFANVIVNVPSSQVDRIFEYEIPQNLELFLKVGSRIKIPFGEANRLIHGFVIDIHSEKQYDGEVKQIDDVPDLRPVINEEQFKLANHLKEVTFSPLVRILNSMIPEALKMKTLKYLQIEDIQKMDAELVEEFKGKSNILLTKDILKKYASKIKKAIDLGLAEIVYDAVDHKSLRYEKVYGLTKDYQTNFELIQNSKTVEILSTLQENYFYPRLELYSKGLNAYQIKKLLKLKILKESSIQKSRIKERTYNINYEYYVSKSSKEAKKFYDNYCNDSSLKKNQNILWIPRDDLEIVQGLSLVIKDNIENDKQTLIVVPEILSSFKIADLIKEYLGIPVVCINSEIPMGENYENYLGIIKKDYYVIVTTPIGVLWPYQNLGTIFVLDEESENYYNDQSPRYDVKEVMKYRSEYHSIKLVFESFTPDVEYYLAALENNLKLIDNKNNLTQPPKAAENIQVIAMTNELRAGNISPISRQLASALEKALEQNIPSLLILNNKGYSDFVICRSCGFVEKCEKCNISYKYRQKDQKLYCPSCGKTKAFVKTCGQCGSKTVKFMGYGAERLKEYLENTYPNANIAIVNQPKYKEFKNIIQDVEKQMLNIIIATDIYSRGFSNTSFGVVGILALDLVSKAPGIKGNQKVYSLLDHAKNILKVDDNHNDEKTMYVQTYNPNHFVLEAFVTNNYQKYVREEAHNRFLLNAPPYYEWNRILVKGPYGSIFKIAEAIRTLIYKINPSEINVIGPVYNYTEQAAQLIIKHKHLNLQKLYQNIYEQYQNTNLTVMIDRFPKSII